MAEDPDRDALSWSGETDPTHVAVPATSSNKASVKAATKASAKAAKQDAAAAAAPNPVLLIVLGILAGVYLLYAVGWGIHAFATSVPVSGVFFGIMYQLGEALSIASPFLWAGALWLLVKKPVWRLWWLFVGVLVLAPWPFILGG